MSDLDPSHVGIGAAAPVMPPTVSTGEQLHATSLVSLHGSDPVNG